MQQEDSGKLAAVISLADVRAQQRDNRGGNVAAEAVYEEAIQRAAEAFEEYHVHVAAAEAHLEEFFGATGHLSESLVAAMAGTVVAHDIRCLIESEDDDEPEPG